MLSLPSFLSLSLSLNFVARPLAKDYELFHPAKQISSIFGESVCTGFRKSGGNNNRYPCQGPRQAGDARFEGDVLRIAEVENEEEDEEDKAESEGELGFG